tara:strand:- start:8697 stop:9584 length:888 start_codon:yes stop_codon:yes gene_type:complete
MTAVKHLIVTSALALPASTINSCVSTYGLDPAAAIVLTNCALAADGTFAGALAGKETVDMLVSLADDPNYWHTAPVMKAMSACLKPGSQFVAATLASSGAVGKADATSTETIATMLVAGFTGAATSAASSKGVVASVTATKPQWQKGAAFSLKSRNQKEKVDSSASRNSNWHPADLAEDDLLDEEDLLDEDDLLDESDFRKGADEAAAAKKAGGECSTKKSACKNCSCGRAQMEAAGGEMTDEKSAAFKSSCGNCYLGDAFRCDGCPMLGTAAGNPAEALHGGTKVTVDLGGDDF